VNKFISFLLLIIVIGGIVTVKQYDQSPAKNPTPGFSINFDEKNFPSPLTVARRAQLEQMAQRERSKIKVQVEHDNSPFTNSYPMILDATGSFDPDLGDKIHFKWRQVSGPKVTLKPNHFSSKVSFIGSPGDYQFELTVSDDYGAKHTVIKSVLIEPEGNLAPIIDMKIRQGSELN